MKILLVLTALLFYAVPASAEMYRWVDAQGKVHYSDQPPTEKSKSSKTLNIPNQPAASAAESNKSWQEKDLDYKKRQAAASETEAKKKKEAEDAKAKVENCDKSKKALKALEEGGRINTYDEKGNRSVMDDAQRAKAMDDAKKAISEWCK
ncbi:MAG: DUF4124 domain-containing protein [Burkholderiales bacterium]|nr:DUF4124 domain-containing protein [Burkholderiales bacterium]